MCVCDVSVCVYECVPGSGDTDYCVSQDCAFLCGSSWGICASVMSISELSICVGMSIVGSYVRQ